MVHPFFSLHPNSRVMSANPSQFQHGATATGPGAMWVIPPLRKSRQNASKTAGPCERTKNPSRKKVTALVGRPVTWPVTWPNSLGSQKTWGFPRLFCRPRSDHILPDCLAIRSLRARGLYEARSCVRGPIVPDGLWVLRSKSRVGLPRLEFCRPPDL